MSMLARLWQEVERLDVFRADRAEVATIGGEDCGDGASFGDGDGDDARIGAAEWEVGILVDLLGHAFEVVLDEVGHDEVAVGERSENAASAAEPKLYRLIM
jgi:hypothetical protein